MHRADEAKGQSKKKRAIGGVAHSLAARHPPSPVVDLGLAQAPELELHRVALQKEDPPLTTPLQCWIRGRHMFGEFTPSG